MGAVPHHPGVEPEDINTNSLFAVIAVSSIIVVILVAIGFNISMQKFKTVQLEAAEMTGYPMLHETEMMGTAKMNRYEANDDGTYRIPIERAMEMEAQDAQ